MFSGLIKDTAEDDGHRENISRRTRHQHLHSTSRIDLPNKAIEAEVTSSLLRHYA